MLKFRPVFPHFYATQIRGAAFDATRVEWEGVVGLEVHAQIHSKSKLFSGADTTFSGGVNSQVALFDAAIPGTLPVLNKECVKQGVLTAIALNCEIHSPSWFDRKHYFYADLPAGYQITQQRAPFATNGSLEFHCYSINTRSNSYLKTTRIKQIQLEQDSGKSIHEFSANSSLVDLNRAGNPLMEIVFEPDLKNGDEAACLVKELISILKALGSCSCKLQEGGLRVDANVSVRPKGSQVLGTRTEVKNIGSINGVLKAVNFEIDRQIKFRKLNKPIINETRSWDASLNRTVPMRDKEVELDYRFMPEPNLPPLKLQLDEKVVESDLIDVPSLRKQLPVMPSVFRNILFQKYTLSVDTVLRLLVDPVLMNHFIFIMDENPSRNATSISNFLMLDVLAALNRANLEPETSTIDSKSLGELFDLVLDGTINRIIFRRILDKMVAGETESPSKLVERDNLYQINDRSILEESCKLAIEFNPEWVIEYKKSKKMLRKKNFQKLIVEAISHTEERANLKAIKEILEKLLNSEN